MHDSFPFVKRSAGNILNTKLLKKGYVYYWSVTLNILLKRLLLADVDTNLVLKPW